MNEQIYYADGNQRRGPFSLDEIRRFNLAPNTLVWYKGLAEWTPICQAPLTAPYYVQQTPQYGPMGGYRPQNPNAVPPKPNTYMALAVLSTIFCCLIFGIISIVYASKVDTLYYAGQYDEAYNASSKAKKWALWSILSSLIIFVAYVAVLGGQLSYYGLF